MRDKNEADERGAEPLPAEINQALRRMSWDDKLARAREARAKVLAASEKDAPPRETFEEFSQRFKPSRRKPPKRAQPVEPAPEEVPDRPAETPRQVETRKYSVGVIALSAAAGAFLHWGATHAVDFWQSERLAPAPQVATQEASEDSTEVFVSALTEDPLDLRTPGTPVSAVLALPSNVSPPTLERVAPLSLPQLVQWVDPVLASTGWLSLSEASTDETGPVVNGPAGNGPVEIGLFIPARLSDEVAGAALAALSGDDTRLVSSSRVPFTVRQTQVRFYHADDAGPAADTAAALGGVARDFTETDRKPSPGRLEVYLAGDGGDEYRGTVAMQRMNQLEYYLLRFFEQF